ncbi:MAG: hypothetical protein ACOCUC_00340, partial [bacterium]
MEPITQRRRRAGKKSVPDRPSPDELAQRLERYNGNAVLVQVRTDGFIYRLEDRYFHVPVYRQNGEWITDFYNESLIQSTSQNQNNEQGGMNTMDNKLLPPGVQAEEKRENLEQLQSYADANNLLLPAQFNRAAEPKQ